MAFLTNTHTQALTNFSNFHCQIPTKNFPSLLTAQMSRNQFRKSWKFGQKTILETKNLDNMKPTNFKIESQCLSSPQIHSMVPIGSCQICIHANKINLPKQTPKPAGIPKIHELGAEHAKSIQLVCLKVEDLIDIISLWENQRWFPISFLELDEKQPALYTASLKSSLSVLFYINPLDTP